MRMLVWWPRGLPEARRWRPDLLRLSCLAFIYTNRRTLDIDSVRVPPEETVRSPTSRRIIRHRFDRHAHVIVPKAKEAPHVGSEHTPLRTVLVALHLGAHPLRLIDKRVTRVMLLSPRLHFGPIATHARLALARRAFVSCAV